MFHDIKGTSKKSIFGEITVKVHRVTESDCLRHHRHHTEMAPIGTVRRRSPVSTYVRVTHNRLHSDPNRDSPIMRSTLTHVHQRTGRTPTRTVLVRRPDKESGSCVRMSTRRPNPRTYGPRLTPRQRVRTLRRCSDESTGPPTGGPDGYIDKEPGSIPVCQRTDRTPYTRPPSGTPTKSPDPIPEYRQTGRTPKQVVPSGHPNKESTSRTRVSTNRPDPLTDGLHRTSLQKVRN